tara:strand:- start:181 stop:801 length:621 start_codon:yes stop_codon:yes gene_type:complete
MASNKELSRFVRDALTTGKSRDEIATVLVQSGWSVREVDEAMRAWADSPFSPPVPRPQATLSAQDFFVYALMFGVLLFGACYLVSLLHALIDRAFEPGIHGSFDQMRWAVAVLLVTVPMYLWLSLRDRARLVVDPALNRSTIRKWLTYLTLLAAAAVMLGQMVAVIYAFLSGEMTGQFAAKALVVGVVAGGIFTYYLADSRRGDDA